MTSIRSCAKDYLSQEARDTDSAHGKPGRFCVGGVPIPTVTAATDRCSLSCMKAMIFPALAVAALAGCDVPTPQPNACHQSRTYGEMFGTPENKGPCWGPIISSAQGGQFRTYMMQLPVPGYVLGDVTYQGSTLIQAGVSRVR